MRASNQNPELSWVTSHWTFKESANSGGPPDLRGRRQNPRPNSASTKSGVNSRCAQQSQKRKPVDPARQVEICPNGVSAGPKRRAERHDSEVTQAGTGLQLPPALRIADGWCSRWRLHFPPRESSTHRCVQAGLVLHPQWSTDAAKRRHGHLATRCLHGNRKDAIVASITLATGKIDASFANGWF